MSTVTTTRHIALDQLGVGATMAHDADAGTYAVTAELSESELQAAIDAAPNAVDPGVQQAADEQAWRDAVTKASSIADLKAVLLGSNTPVRPVVDRKP